MSSWKKRRHGGSGSFQQQHAVTDVIIVGTTDKRTV